MVAGVVGGGVGQVLGVHQCCSKDRGGDLPHGQGWWAVVLQLSVGITGADKSMKTVQIKSDNECRSFLYYFDACCGGTCDKWILQWGWEETIPAITLITLHTNKHELYELFGNQIIFVRYPNFKWKCPNHIFCKFCHNMRYKSKHMLLFYSFIVLWSWTM